MQRRPAHSDVSTAQAVGISGGIGANVQSAAQILQLLADCSQDHSFRTTSAQMPVASAFSTVSGSSAESEHGFTRHADPRPSVVLLTQLCSTFVNRSVSRSCMLCCCERLTDKPVLAYVAAGRIAAGSNHDMSAVSACLLCQRLTSAVLGSQIKRCCTQEAEPSRAAAARARGATGAAKQGADAELPDEIQSLASRLSAAADAFDFMPWHECRVTAAADVRRGVTRTGGQQCRRQLLQSLCADPVARATNLRAPSRHASTSLHSSGRRLCH